MTRVLHFDSKMLQDRMFWIGQLCLLQDLSSLEGGSDRIMLVEIFRNKLALVQAS